MNPRRIPAVSTAVATLVAVTILAACATAAQTQTPPAGGGGQPATPTVDESDAQAMMAERRQMMASMQAMDQQLKELVATMNSASGDAKVNAIAAVVSTLAAQRMQMHDRMAGMQNRMMAHMMEHMRSMQGGMMGMMGGRGQAGAMPSMGSCPMMQELSKDAGGQ